MRNCCSSLLEKQVFIRIDFRVGFR